MKNKLISFEKYNYEIIRMNLFNLQVCSNCPPEEIEKIESEVRKSSPAGTTGNWYIEKEGNLAPVKCENAERYHYVFVC